MTVALPPDGLPAGSMVTTTTVTTTTRTVTSERLPGAAVAGLASLGAGAIHAGAIGLHAEHASLSRIFVVVALFQLGWGLAVLLRPSRTLAALGAVGNLAAVAGWAITRVADISWIGGLEQAEAPQFTDTVCAGLGLVAAGAALAAVLVGPRRLPTSRVGLPALAVAALAVPAMFVGSSHVHAEGDHAHGAGDAAHAADGTHLDGAPHDDGATHAADGTHLDGAAHDDGGHDAVAWPRPYDPTQPIDLSGVPGVTPEQEARATTLLATTQDVLPRFADVTTVGELGFRSIGDARTGFEHFINYGYINDDRFLDPEYPESLVFQVDGDDRTLVSAMFIAKEMPIDDPRLVDYGGPLMQWHVHDNLCWTLDETGEPKVAGVTADDGSCPPGSINTGGGNPMVHVWIAPHQCGPFAALEGHGAGQVDPDSAVRTDQCEHGHGDDHSASADAKPYDPEMPIDLSGMPGVTPQQQARAENLIAITLARLPQFADPADAERRGFRSIGDGATGYEHYINWSYINDDKILDPDYPESLVFTPNPDGTKTLVSAMFMLPDGETLDTVPDVGGPLTQWHIHDNLCFSNDPAETGQTVVIGLTGPDGTCARGVKLQENPMLHVWITPHPCGPFAALEGVGAGQIKEGEERLCDVAHGSH